MSESLKNTVSQVTTTLENVTGKVDELTAAHDQNVSRLEGLERKVEDLASKGLTAAETIGHAGGGLVQEIVDFLHWAFPSTAQGGKPVPGKPSTETEADKPAEVKPAEDKAFFPARGNAGSDVLDTNQPRSVSGGAA